MTGDEDNKLCIASARDSGLARQLSRQTQLDDRITAALQKLNEQDDEGRSLPGELTADDVGRTMVSGYKRDQLPFFVTSHPNVGINDVAKKRKARRYALDISTFGERRNAAFTLFDKPFICYWS